MRIEAYTQIQQMYQAKKTSQTKNTSKTGSMDQVQISSFGKDIQTAKAAIAAAPDIREGVTAPIKAQITAGTYEVNTDAFAEKLLQKYNEAR